MQAVIRRGLRGLAVGAVLGFVAVATPTAAAAAEPAGGCNQPFELFTVDKVVKMANPAYEEDIRRADRNADNYLCVKVDDRGGTYHDNTGPV